ncbi:MAG: cryptochrome/photolyase family protein [Chitinophagales bacterium]
MKIAIHWFRRDLRWDDNTALSKALSGEFPILPLFIFDTNILDKLENKYDRRVHFIHRELSCLQEGAVNAGSSLLIKCGKPIEIWKELLEEYDIGAVYTNRDYEPYAQERDKTIYDLLQKQKIPFKGSKDHVIFEKKEVVKKDGKPYTVFTPYSKKWLAAYHENPPQIHPFALHSPNFYKTKSLSFPTLSDIGFEETNADFPSMDLDEKLLDDYKELRNFPAQNHTSHLSVHFRFGTISIRKMAKKGLELSAGWLNELIWRDFYQAIIYHFPHSVHKAFKPAYENIPWRNNEAEFEKWCEGKTGYPLVDAGMRELNQTGFMHNRVRMVVASFLTKHLLIDWRWGEAYFAEKLLDFELASNNGGWQWAASTGCDAAPYFRIFNPTSQLKKFDKELQYVKRWVEEYGTDDYPQPIVEHKFGRERALRVYKGVLAEFRRN